MILHLCQPHRDRFVHILVIDTQQEFTRDVEEELGLEKGSDEKEGKDHFVVLTEVLKPHLRGMLMAHVEAGVGSLEGFVEQEAQTTSGCINYSDRGESSDFSIVMTPFISHIRVDDELEHLELEKASVY